MGSNDEFRHYILVADALVKQATRDQLVEALKLLAINFGYLTQRHGGVPQDMLLRKTQADTLTAETRKMVIAGLRQLVGLLGHILEEPDETRH